MPVSAHIVVEAFLVRHACGLGVICLAPVHSLSWDEIAHFLPVLCEILPVQVFVIAFAVGGISYRVILRQLLGAAFLQTVGKVVSRVSQCVHRSSSHISPLVFRDLSVSRGVAHAVSFPLCLYKIIDFAGISAAQTHVFRCRFLITVQLAVLPRTLLLRSSPRLSLLPLFRLLGKELFLILLGTAHTVLPQKVLCNIFGVASIRADAHDLIHIREIGGAGIRIPEWIFPRCPGRSAASRSSGCTGALPPPSIISQPRLRSGILYRASPRRRLVALSGVLSSLRYACVALCHGASGLSLRDACGRVCRAASLRGTQRRYRVGLRVRRVGFHRLSSSAHIRFSFA